VNHALFDPSGPPAESRVALSAIHLVTSVNLEYHRGTLWTISRILGEKLSRRQTVWIALVGLVLVWTLNFVAMGASPDVAPPTLPSRTQETPAVSKGAGSNKLTVLPFDTVSTQLDT
jgi:hypothetical protein